MSKMTDDQKFRNAIEAAWRDPVYKSRLLKDPVKALGEFDIACPNCNVKVIESKEDECYFILPPAPASELTDEEIKKKSDNSDYKVLVHVLYNVNCC